MNQLTATRWNAARGLLNPCLAMALLLSLVACGSLDVASQITASDADFEVAPPPNFTRGLMARRAAEPLYPLRARNLGVEGWVMLRFSVDEDGAVIGNSIRTIEEQPSGYFVSSAVNAARRMTFENTRGEVVEGIGYVFRYQLEDRNRIRVRSTSDVVQFREILPIRFVTPRYPAVALELELEGYVVVKFTVTRAGAVENIVIDESEPPGVFNDEAMAAAQRLRFDPRMVLGNPVSVDDVLYRFDWNVPD